MRVFKSIPNPVQNQKVVHQEGDGDTVETDITLKNILPLVDHTKENTNGQFQRVLDDSGFCDFEGLIETKRREKEYYLLDCGYQKKYNKNHFFTQKQFIKNEMGQLICLAGREMKSKEISR